MAGAFQANAFQASPAFQTGAVVPPVQVGGGGSSFYTPRRHGRAKGDALRDAIRESLNPTPAVALVADALPEAVKSERVVHAVVFDPIDIAPIQEAVTALIAEQHRLAAENQMALESAYQAQLADDALAMELIEMLLL